MTNCVVGSVTGTGAALTIQCGFVPAHVRIANITDGTTIDEWWQGMAADTSITSTSAAVATRAAPGGISAFAGSATQGAGFTIGAAISVSGKVLKYIAIEEGPGWQG